MEITGSLGRGAEAKKHTSKYEFGGTTAKAAQLFGDTVVYDGFVGKEVINVQNLIRNGIKAGKKPAEIDTMVAAWKPGVKVSRGKSKYEKTLANVADLTPEQLAAVAKAAGEELARRKK